MDKNAIRLLKKLDTSCNTASNNHINDTFNDMTLEDTSQEKSLIHQKRT